MMPSFCSMFAVLMLAIAAVQGQADRFMCSAPSNVDQCPSLMIRLNAALQCGCYNFCNGSWASCGPNFDVSSCSGVAVTGCVNSDRNSASSGSTGVWIPIGGNTGGAGAGAVTSPMVAPVAAPIAAAPVGIPIAVPVAIPITLPIAVPTPAPVNDVTPAPVAVPTAPAISEPVAVPVSIPIYVPAPLPVATPVPAPTVITAITVPLPSVPKPDVQAPMSMPTITFGPTNTQVEEIVADSVQQQTNAANTNVGLVIKSVCATNADGTPRGDCRTITNTASVNSAIVDESAAVTSLQNALLTVIVSIGMAAYYII